MLAALNIADDYFRSLDGRADDERHVLDRMLAIEAMVDRAVGGALSTPDTPEPPPSPAGRVAFEPPEPPATAPDHSA